MPELDSKARLVGMVTQRLFAAVGILLVAILLLLGAGYWLRTDIPMLLLCLLLGVLGGFVGIQKRLKQMDEVDLQLLANSWLYTALSPLIGGVLAMLLYAIFISGLLAGDLFPRFENMAFKDTKSFLSLLDTHAEDYTDYGKLVFWSFVAGFSERFVIDIISQFQKKAAG